VSEERFPAVLRGAAASDLPPSELVRGVTASTLILGWTDDPDHPLSTTQRLVELLPASELVVATSLRAVASWTDQALAFLDHLDASHRA
jgi:3-oxoadipate enol-lactonase